MKQTNHFLAALLLLAVSLSATTPALSQKKLDGIVQHWRHVLLLDDWDVTAITVRIDALQEGTAGQSEVIPEYQGLIIHVLDPADYAELATRNKLRVKTGKAITRDIEDTVVHELVHLRLRSFRMAKDNELSAAEELVVTRLTTALLRKR